MGASPPDRRGLLRGRFGYLLETVAIEELAAVGPDDERYEAKVTVMMEQVRHHVEEEETDWFPKVRKALDRARLQELGAKLATAKKRAPRTPQPDRVVAR